MSISIKLYEEQTNNDFFVHRFTLTIPENNLLESLHEKIKIVVPELDLTDIDLTWKDEDGDTALLGSDDEVQDAFVNAKDGRLKLYATPRNWKMKQSDENLENGENEAEFDPPEAIIIPNLLSFGGDVEDCTLTKIGFQIDGGDDLWTGIANTKWGLIPGKASHEDGAWTCWFGYDGKEYSTDNFFFLNSSDSVDLSLKESDGSIPSNVVNIPAPYDEFADDIMHPGVAVTQWGLIPGYIEEDNGSYKCFYTYDGEQLETEKFCWITQVDKEESEDGANLSEEINRILKTIPKPPPKKVLTWDEEFREGVLERHNYYRARHGAPPLKRSTTLDNLAQDWADHLMRTGVLSHRPNNQYVECCYGGWGNFSGSQKPTDPVDSFYKEIRQYNYSSPGFSFQTGHFTQVVWAGSQELGTGVSISGGNVFVVCNYNPPGNMQGAFQKNVFPARQ